MTDAEKWLAELLTTVRAALPERLRRKLPGFLQRNRAKLISLLEARLAADEQTAVAPCEVSRAPEPEPAVRDEVRGVIYRLLERQTSATQREILRELASFNVPESTLRTWIEQDPYLHFSLRDGDYRLRPLTPSGGKPPPWAEHGPLWIGSAQMDVWRCERCSAYVLADQDPAMIRHNYGCPYGPVAFPKSKLAEIQRLLRKLNKKASKLGVGGGLELRVVREFLRKVHVGEHDTPDGRDRCTPQSFPLHWPDIPHVEIAVQGEVAKIPGYRVLGVLQHPDTPDVAGNIVKSVPGEHVPRKFWHAPPECDHCVLQRRRKETVVLEGPDGVKQVGRTCLADYTGSGDAEPRIRAYLDFQAFWDHVRAAMEAAELEGLGEDDEGAERMPVAMDLGDFLAWVIGCVRAEGFVSKKMLGPDHSYTTGECAMVGGMDAHKRGVQPEPADLEEAQAVLAWAQENITPATAKKAFDHNLAVVVARSYVDPDTMAYAPWILKKYRERAAKPREEVNEYRPEPVGDDPITMQLTVTRKLDVQGYYGRQTLYLATDEAGRAVKFYASAKDVGPEVGETVQLVAQILKKDVYRGTHQTTVKKLSRGWLKVDPSESPERAALRARAQEILVRGGLSGNVKGLLQYGLANNTDDLDERVAAADLDYKRRRSA